MSSSRGPSYAFQYPGMNPAFRRFRGRRAMLRGAGMGTVQTYKKKFTRKHTYGPAPPGAEAKCFDQYDAQAATFGTANTATILALNCVTEGTSYKTRMGARVKNKSIDIHLWPFFAGGGAGYVAGEIYRIMLVYDSQPNGALPSTADLLKSTGGGTTAGSPVNLDNRDRFLILREHYMQAPTPSASGTASTVGAQANGRLQEQCIHWYVKLRNLETIYKATAGAITDIASGALLLVLVCESTTACFALSISSRLRFYD